MKEPQTMLEYTTEVGGTIFAFLKCSKLYIILIGFFSWFFSMYPIKDILVVFTVATFVDTVTRIHANAKTKGLKFNPLKKYFWLEIKSSGLKLMGRKLFMDYSIPILFAFLIDTLIFKNTLHFDLITLRLSIPSAAILFFTGVEIWSIFENLEDAGGVNWVKKASRWFSGLLPDKWKDVYDKITGKEE